MMTELVISREEVKPHSYVAIADGHKRHNWPRSMPGFTTWESAPIQVFEYYISHHLTKAFESMFGGVTCSPGCFSIYRIMAPKGQSGYWVPILAKPDTVEHYSENTVDTLHKKNLLLLDVPKRKMVFFPQVVCKTIVPDTFSVLLSQHRCWINSTIYNLAELVLAHDLCGTFCVSMQLVMFMEFAGTLVLPAAISFTIYLIVSAIIPSDGLPPVIPLILPGTILGLPGLLIVVTSHQVAYLGWMIVYLFSLPIWNLVLPAYAFGISMTFRGVKCVWLRVKIRKLDTATRRASLIVRILS
ncbi:Chitin synthase, class 3 [Ceratobasidium sp. UAMH 11750]|nr:Chitin synthase, class 3 [Ceratobasidium sp. UAMH 11750]